MTKWYLKDPKVYIGGYDFGSAHSEIQMSLSRRTLPVNAFGDDTELFKLGLRAVRLSGRGYWDAGTPTPPAPTVADSGVAGNPDGVYKCQITYVTAAGESLPSAEASVTVVTNKISWTSIAPGPVGTTARKLYRTVAGGGTGTELLVTTLADNTTTSYTDDVADGALGAAVPTVDTSGLVQLIDDALYGNLFLADVPITLVPSIGQGVGGAAYSIQHANASYKPILGAHGDVVGFEYEIAASAAKVIRGEILHAGAIAASGAGTARQLGAATASQRLYGVIHAYGFTGTSPTLDVVVESDALAGFGSPATQITFAQKTTWSSEWASAAGPITDDWFRVNKTLGGGGGPTFSAIVIAARQ